MFEKLRIDKFQALALFIFVAFYLHIFFSYNDQAKSECKYSYIEDKLVKDGLYLDGIRIPYENVQSRTSLEILEVPRKRTFPEYKFSSNERLKYLKRKSSIPSGSQSIVIPMGVLSLLNHVQYALDMHGSIGEIGVFSGAFFIPLVHLAFKGEYFFACDVFSQQIKNPDQLDGKTLQEFTENIKLFGINPEDVMIYEGSSLELHTKFTTELHRPKFRLISLDGGHTRQYVFHDLTLAAENLMHGGIIIVDDIQNIQNLGAIDGVISWLTVNNYDIAPFFIGQNKLFLTHKDFHRIYYSAIYSHPFWSQYAFAKNQKGLGYRMHSLAGYDVLYMEIIPDETEAYRQWRFNIK